MANTDQHPLLDTLTIATFLNSVYLVYKCRRQRREAAGTLGTATQAAHLAAPQARKSPSGFKAKLCLILGVVFKIILAIAIFGTICDIVGADFVTQDPFAETSVEQEELAEQEEPMEQEGAVVQTAPAASTVTYPRYQATQGEIECSYARDLLREQYPNMSYSSQWEELLDRGYTAQEAEYAMGQ